MHTAKWLCACLLLGASLSAMQTPVEPAGLLGRIRRAVSTHLSELPNYTCHQTIERSLRLASSRKAQPLDTIHLEIAYVGGRELFGWPGAGKFEDKNIHELVGGSAAIGNGFFAAHVHEIFMTDAAAFTYAGESESTGRKCFRYEYRIPLAKSHFIFDDGARAGVVGYFGSFWADAETLELVRLEVRVSEFPAGILAKSALDVMEYSKARIGDRDFLLPQFSEMLVVNADGRESRNTSRLGECRQYLGESVIKFGEEPAEQPVQPNRAPVVVTLPEGLEIEASLRTRIESKVAIGDAISASVSRDSKRGNLVLVPKGAMLLGHVTRVEARRTRGFQYFILGIAFSSFEADGRRGEFRASVEAVDTPASNNYYAPQQHGQPGPSIWSSVPFDLAGLRPDEGIIYLKEMLRMPPGLLLRLMIARK